MALPGPTQTLTCKKCGYTRIYKPKSDCIGVQDLKARFCPKCNVSMESSPVKPLDAALMPIKNIISIFKG